VQPATSRTAASAPADQIRGSLELLRAATVTCSGRRFAMRGVGYQTPPTLLEDASAAYRCTSSARETGERMDLDLNVRKDGDHSVLEVAGEIDVYTAPKLREQLIELVSDGSYHIVVDLEKVDFLDSTGLGVLVGGLKRVRNHDGSLQLVCTQEKILKIFRITGLTKVFPIHSSVADAVSAPTE
jgi:anti-sigma B factor antagonist